MRRWLFDHRRKLMLLLGTLLMLPAGAHLAIRQGAQLTPPNIEVSARHLHQAPDGTRRFGDSSVRQRGKILQVNLKGTPEQLGYAHARLLYSQMVANETVLWGRLQRTVPNSWVRAALLDIALLKYQDVHQGIAPPRLREIAGTARGFEPDPFSDFFDTFQRFVYLNALYDIALSFEHSPLIGCTSFVLNAGNSSGTPLLARSFDFEVDPIFDRDKAVFLVEESGKIPFASVAWPGLVGVVTGMNLQGLALVVHGGRAATPRSTGEPVVHALRRVLSSSATTGQAVQALQQREAMVSHIVVVLDASGEAAVVERAPGHQAHVRRLGAKAAVTNHFEGPLSENARNLRVIEETSTLPRRRRADELLGRLSPPALPAQAVRLLRDRLGPKDRELPLGNRNAIDALIATHGVVIDTERRHLWVSEGPHLLGRFILFDLPRLREDPNFGLTDLETIAADPALVSPAVKRLLAEEKKVAQ